MTLEDLILKLNLSDGYMLTATTITGETLEHMLLIEKFRKIDMIPSHKETRELVIEELEKKDEAY